MQPTSAKVLFGALWPAAPEGLRITSVVTDSRQAGPGCVFVAIKGERVDGRDYAAVACAAGAAAVLTDRPIEELPPEKTVLVPNVLDALISLGGNYRRQYNPLVLGVTGSVGKTTTKDFCGAVLGAFGPALKTDGNQNNEIGLPKTLFKLDENVRYAVLEMAMTGLGEIRKLSLAAHPSAAIITMIGTAHLEHLGSRENILRAKLEICEGLSTGAPLVLNADDLLLRNAVLPAHVRPVYVGLENADCPVHGELLRQEGQGQYLRIHDKQYGSYDAYIPALGRHNAMDALFAYAASTRLGLNPGQSAAALSAYVPSALRQEIKRWAGVTLVEDCYNASPDSMAAALETFALLPVEGRRIAVVGDMLELGATAEMAHRGLGAQMQGAGVSLVLAVGPLAALAAQEAAELGVESLIFTDNNAAAQALAHRAKAGDAVLLKASRGMRFEEIAQMFRNSRPDVTDA